MLREPNMQDLSWAEKTMSVMEARQLEACESRLRRMPKVGLFTDCNDLNVEKLWRWSYDALEHPAVMRLHTTRELQAQVMKKLPMEAALLSVEEHMLLERMIVLGGRAELMEWRETRSAESLARRLWCTVTYRDERTIVRLPRELLIPLTAILSSEEHVEFRERLLQFEAAIRGLLYIGGLLHFAEPLEHLYKDVLEGTSANDAHLVMRYLRNSFDYSYDDQGDMLLLHPGLAEPERMMAEGLVMTETHFQLDEATVLGAMAGILPGELPSFYSMSGMLHGNTRPGISAEEAVEDLRMLAKQGVSLEEMKAVLPTMLTVQPTAAMYAGVKQIYMQTLRWGTMCSACVH